MKKRFLWITLFLLMFLVGCTSTNTTTANDEVITYQGLEDGHVFLGETFNLLSGVTFTSSSQGDITTTVETVGDINLSILGVHLVSYQTHYVNNEPFIVERRIVVMYPPFGDAESNNLLSNGDFSDTMNYWGIARYTDYPDSMNFIIDPDLKRMQVIIVSASNMVYTPNLNQTNLTLENSNTYELSLLVSGTNTTFFSIDIVELNQTGQVLSTLVNTLTVNVGIQDGEMQVVQFEITPLVSSTNATLRLMFGETNNNQPTGEIYIDNVLLTLLSD